MVACWGSNNDHGKFGGGRCPLLGFAELIFLIFSEKLKKSKGTNEKRRWKKKVKYLSFDTKYDVVQKRTVGFMLD